MIRLVIGLGNPGKTYAHTYHNAGHQFAEYARETWDGGPAILISDVFMNASGSAVLAALKKYRVKPEELLVAHDDSDLALGSVKVSFGRGAAGHHGIESIIAALHTNRFWRARIGIRPREEKIRMKASELVLKKVSRVAKSLLEKGFADALLKIQGISGEKKA
ncbi:MAG: aminoacyl-tRNA hydrolase [Patescibacteria group bacterium]